MPTTPTSLFPTHTGQLFGRTADLNTLTKNATTKGLTAITGRPRADGLPSPALLH